MSRVYRNETWKAGVLVRVETFDFGAGTVTVEEEGVVVSTRPTTAEDEARFAPPPPTEDDAIRAASRLTVQDKLDTLPLTIVQEVAPLFDLWQPGGIYALGDVRRWDGTLIRCLQGHTNADPNHTPDTTPALWTIYRASPGAEYPAWVQPESTNPYNLTWDDGTGPVIVTHNGRLWENLVDGNVWEPGAAGTESLWADLGPA